MIISPTNFNIYWWFLSAKIIAMMFVKWWLFVSLFIPPLLTEILCKEKLSFSIYLFKHLSNMCLDFSINMDLFVIVQSLSHVWIFATPWTTARQASPSFTISQSLLKLICIESVMPSNHLILNPFSSCQSFPASRASLVSRLFTPVDQSIGASASASVLPMNIQGWFPLGLTGLISLLSKKLSRVFSSTTVWKHQFFGSQSSLWSNSHSYMTTGKNHSLDYMDFFFKLYNIVLVLPNTKWGLFFLICCLGSRNKCLLISWLQSPSTVILEPKKIKSITVSTLSSSICMKWWNWMP